MDQRGESAFSRTALLLGEEALSRLRSARVAVFGLGAVGSYAVEGLARAGIGSLLLVDDDVIRSSNLNRQLYALTSSLGKPKVEVAAARVADINPACQVESHRLRVGADGAANLLEPTPDAVVDAIDSLPAKIALLAAAVRAGAKVIVSSMGAATRLDPDAVRVDDIAQTASCPVARKVRASLRRGGVTGGIRCVYSTEPSRSFAPAPAPRDEGSPGRARAPLGSLSCLPGIFGLRVALEVIGAIAGEPRLAPPALPGNRAGGRRHG